MAKNLTPSRITPNQEKKYQRLVEAATKQGIARAIEEIDSNSFDWQKVVKGGDEIFTAISNFIVSITKENIASEQLVKPDYGFLSCNMPHEVIEQSIFLQSLFPNIGSVNQNFLSQIEKGNIKLPGRAEGWFAIVNWLKHKDIFGDTYCEALGEMFKKIQQATDYKFIDYYEIATDFNFLYQLPDTQNFYHRLICSQDNPDILIVPARLGIHEQSFHDSHWREPCLSNEVGLGTFAVTNIILTDLGLLKRHEDLDIVCSGDNERYHEIDPVMRIRYNEIKFGYSKTEPGYSSLAGSLAKGCFA